MVQADQDTYDRYAALVQHARSPSNNSTMQNTSWPQIRPRSGGNQADVKSALARLGGKADAPIEQMPAYKQAKAQVGRGPARAIDHSIVRAPFAGDGDRR